MSAPFDFSQYQPTLVKKEDQITGITNGASVALTVNTAIAGYVGVLVTVEGGPVRLREDATVPTTTIGQLFNAGDRFIIWGSKNLSNCNVIATTTTNATLDVSWLGTK